MSSGSEWHDNSKLRTWIAAAPDERRGLRLAHLHLSLVEPAAAVDSDALIRRLTELGRGAAHLPFADTSDTAMTVLRRLQILRMSNADLIMAYKGLAYSIIERACREIADEVGAKTSTIGLNPYGERSLYSILDFSSRLADVRRYLEGLRRTSVP